MSQTKRNPDIHYGDISKIVEEDLGAKVIRVANSTFCFLTAFMLSHFCYQFATALAGYVCGMHVFLTFDTVTLPQAHNLWSIKRIILVFSAGTLSVLFLGIMSKWLYNKFRQKKSVINLLCFWLYLHAISLFCMQWVIGAIGVGNYYSPFYTGMAVVASWSGFSPIIFKALALPAVVILVIIGITATEPILGFSFSRRYVQNLQGRKRFFFQISFLPLIISSAVILLLWFPGFIFPAVHLCALLVILMIAFIRSDYLSRVEVLRYESLQFLNWGVVVLLAALIVLMKTALTTGIALSR